MLLRLAGVYDDICHSPPLANQMQRIYERQLASHLYSGQASHGESYVHMDDVVDAIVLAVDRRGQLPAESAILIGEPEALSYDELQHTFQRLIFGESWETYNVPGFIAKAGAWVEEHIPGPDPFIKPWMIDRASDHYALDIEHARSLLDWSPRRSLRKTLPKMVAALKADPPGWYREHKLEPAPSAMTIAEAVPLPNNESGSDAHLQVPTATYTCPMHSEVVRSEPGACPVCGMTLQRSDASAAHHD